MTQVSHCSRLFVAALFCVVAVGSSTAEPWVNQHGKHIRLTTDMVDSQHIDDLIAAFDAAVLQWSQFWQLPSSALSDWSVDAFVMQDPDAFRKAGLIPVRVPDFPFGYAADNKVWVIVQPSEYYTRHLLLHEGVHALAFHHFGGAGPAWYMEGTAELLSTHQNSGRDVNINVLPIDRRSVSHWGRFKVMSDRRRDGKVPSLETVMQMPSNLKGNVEEYGWSWAAAMLLTEYPEYRQTFIDAAKAGRDSGSQFNRDLYKRLSRQWPIIQARWRLMTADLDYGFQWQRERVELSIDDPFWDGNARTLTIDAGTGWQSAGIVISAGSSLAIDATGRVKVNNQDEPWVSEPNGVTIEYVRGRPLGQLLICVLPTRSNSQPKSQIDVIGYTDDDADAVLKSIGQPSWLLFRVNDHVNELSDNDGSYTIRLQELGL